MLDNVSTFLITSIFAALLFAGVLVFDLLWEGAARVYRAVRRQYRRPR